MAAARNWTRGMLVGWRAYSFFCCAVLVFLLLPLFVVIPLSFNAKPYFTLTPEMLRLDPSAFSRQWYAEVIGSREWRSAFLNSLFIGVGATCIATFLGTMAALGLERAAFRGKNIVYAVLLLPIFAPHIVLVTGLYFLYAKLGLLESLPGIVFAHAAIIVPFVLVSVRTALSVIDPSLLKAAANLGAGGAYAFRTVTLPLALPGIAGGALLAFIASFDDLLVVLFLGGPGTTTVPRQMWAGIREDMSPAVLAVSTLLTIVASLALTASLILRRKAEAARQKARAA